MEYENVWILGEQNNDEIDVVSFELLKRGRELADKLNVDLIALMPGYGLESEQLEELIHYGADKVISVDHKMLSDFLVDPHINVVTSLVNKYKPEIVIASATTTGRSVAPAVAINCHAGLTADCTGLDIDDETGNLIQTRPAIGGNILATIKTPNHRPQMATVRPHSNQPLTPDNNRTGEIIREKVEGELLKTRIKQVDFKPIDEEGGNIQDAEIVVAGGKGCSKEENFEMIEKLAELLDGAVGASREAVDLGWISYPHQVGLSGKTVSPKLYVAAGISGAVQHLAGIKTAENIVTINNDPEAQIFSVADFSIQADMFQILPLLIEKLEKRKQSKAQN
ncbi:MAG: electron transfer flavoprotein subunit alpha/FixB family protein [Candidatus Marinimicrobia bacterium]|nr:electron transfer flavoprotein subunit alpha/FixB family protein [Candidatus Neomarinimicrobiota bacterium]